MDFGGHGAGWTRDTTSSRVTARSATGTRPGCRGWWLSSSRPFTRSATLGARGCTVSGSSEVPTATGKHISSTRSGCTPSCSPRTSTRRSGLCSKDAASRPIHCSSHVSSPRSRCARSGTRGCGGLRGWFQVSYRYIWKGLVSRRLTLRQKLGLIQLLTWRELYPWIANQMVPIVIFWTIKYGGLDRIDWLVPIFVLTTIFTLGTGPAQTLLAWRLANRDIRRHAGWFLYYLVMSSLFYTAFKNLIARSEEHTSEL